MVFLAGVVYTWERLFSTFNDVLRLSKSGRIPEKKPVLQGFERWQFLIKSHLLYQLSYEGTFVCGDPKEYTSTDTLCLQKRTEISFWSAVS